MKMPVRTAPWSAAQRAETQPENADFDGELAEDDEEEPQEVARDYSFAYEDGDTSSCVWPAGMSSETVAYQSNVRATGNDRGLWYQDVVGRNGKQE
ncbi:MAG: hypothetical protein STHCBS139747_005764 [Sporothrix thermara]